MILYLDTSALAKLFISEPGSEAVATAVGTALAVATYRIAYVEMHATLGRAVRMNRIPASSLEPWLGEFESRWASLDVVDLSDSMARRAAELAIRYGGTALTAFTWPLPWPCRTPWLVRSPCPLEPRICASRKLRPWRG